MEKDGSFDNTDEKSNEKLVQSNDVRVKEV